MDQPACLPYEAFAAARAPRGIAGAFPHLWVSGALDGLARPTIAVVGTRAATPYGRGIARRIARDLAQAGCCIISGLALGIDAAAHEGALEGGGITIGVLGGGHATFFPRRNRPLAERMIAAGGAVLSPFEPNEAAYPWKFLYRNGIVVALADAVVVVEAPAKSGALNTAGTASGSIPVFVVPGDVDRPHFAGSHALIRDGAIFVRGADDILEEMRLDQIAVLTRAERKREHLDDPLQQTLFDAITQHEATLDTLIDTSCEDAPRVLAALSVLELNGLIESRPGGQYAAR